MTLHTSKADVLPSQSEDPFVASLFYFSKPLTHKYGIIKEMKKTAKHIKAETR